MGTAHFKRGTTDFDDKVLEVAKIAIDVGFRHLDGAEGIRHTHTYVSQSMIHKKIIMAKHKKTPANIC